MWLPSVAKTYGVPSPLKQNQLMLVDPELHAHSPRRRGDPGTPGKYGSIDFPHLPSWRAGNVRHMPPPPIPRAQIASTKAIHPAMLGATPDPFVDRRSQKRSDDSDVSMPDYQQSVPPPAYHELPDASGRGLPRRPRAPIIPPNENSMFDDLAHMIDSPRHIGPLPSPSLAPGLAPPTNTRNNSAANSPPVPPLLGPSDGARILSNASNISAYDLTRDVQQRALSGPQYPQYPHPPPEDYELPRRRSHGPGAAENEPFPPPGSVAAGPYVDGAPPQGRKERPRAIDLTGTAAPSPEHSSATIRPPSSSTLRGGSGTPHASAGMITTPVLGSAATPARRTSGDGKRKRASLGVATAETQRGGGGGGASPRKLSRMEGDGRDRAGRGGDEGAESEVRAQSDGLARGRARRVPGSARESPTL